MAEKDKANAAAEAVVKAQAEAAAAIAAAERAKAEAEAAKEEAEQAKAESVAATSAARRATAEAEAAQAAAQRSARAQGAAAAGNEAQSKLTAAEAARLVFREVRDLVDELDEAGNPVLVGRNRRVPVAEREVLSFKDFGSHVVVVTTDGQKLRSSSRIAR